MRLSRLPSRALPGWAAILPAGLVFAGLFAAPLAYFFVISFWSVRARIMRPDHTLANYLAVWSNYGDVLGNTLLIAAVIALRLARIFVHGVVKTLLDREATEGTAQELSAVELKKRMDTLDGLGANILQFFIVAIAGLMILGQLGLDIAPAIAGLGVSRGRLPGATPDG